MNLKHAYVEFLKTAENTPDMIAISMKDKQNKRKEYEKANNEFTNVISSKSVNYEAECNIESMVTNSEDMHCHQIYASDAKKKRKVLSTESMVSRKKRKIGSKIIATVLPNRKKIPPKLADDRKFMAK